MTFQKSKQHSYLGSQNGITLLLSVLLLTAITTIAFSLAAVGFAELSTSNDLANTEPVFYSGLGTAEEEIYSVKRKVDTVTFSGACSAWLDVTNPPLTQVIGNKKHCRYNPKNEAVYQIPLSKNTENNSVKFYMINPTTGGIGGAGYTEIQLTNSSQDLVLHYSICNYEDSTCTVQDASLSVGSPTPDVNILDPLKSYEVSIWVSQVGGFSGAGAFVTIKTLPIGLPYLNKTSVEIETRLGRLTRRIEALIPNQ